MKNDYINIHINYNDRRLVINDIFKYSSVYRLKREIQRKYNIDITTQRIHYNGRPLINTKPINHYNINKNTILLLNKPKLLGGNKYLAGAVCGMLFGFLFFGIGFIPILIRIYWIILTKFIHKLKEALCMYDRISAAFIGFIIGWLIMSGISHINNNSNYNAYILLFIFVFWLVGSKRFISFLEPMFRNDCIYLDPETKTIRKCKLGSPAYIGFVFIFLIKCFLGAIRLAFKFIMIYVLMTYICYCAAMTIDGVNGYCEGMEVGKRMGKYCLYVYIGIYILYMLPRYMLNLVEASMKYPGFPFNVFRFFFKILEKPIRKLAGPAKFELGVYWVPLPIMYLNILGGIPIRMLHKAVKLALTGIGKYIGLFKGFKCIRSTGHIINFLVDIHTIIEKYNSKKDEHKNEHKDEHIDEDIDSELEKTKEQLFYKYNKHINKIIRYDTTPNKDIKKFINDERTNPFKKEEYSIDDIEKFSRDLFEKANKGQSGLDDFYNHFFASGLTPGKPDLVQQFEINQGNPDKRRESKEEKNNSLTAWAKSDQNWIVKWLTRRLSCFILDFMNFFNQVVDSYGNLDNMIDEIQVAIVAGLACWFAAFVMMWLLLAKGKNL